MNKLSGNNSLLHIYNRGCYFEIKECYRPSVSKVNKIYNPIGELISYGKIESNFSPREKRVYVDNITKYPNY